MTRALLLLPLLSACGPNIAPEIDLTPAPVEDAPVAVQPPCSSKYLRAVDVTAACCELLQINVDVAVSAFRAYGMDVEPAIKRSALVVKSMGPGIGGSYAPSTEVVEILPDMDGLAHEFLHALEDFEGVADWSQPHKGWDTNPSYQKTMSLYYFYHRQLARECAP